MLSQSFTYSESRLYLNYDVSRKVADMIRTAQQSIIIVAYKFIPNSDENRDLFLAFHQLGLRCMREGKKMTISFTFDQRVGLAARIYKPSDVSGLDSLQALGQLYPNLTIHIRRVRHAFRESFHSKIVIVDDQVLFKSGDGNLDNGLAGLQTENAFLFSGGDVAKRTEKAIEDCIRSSEVVVFTTEKTVPPLNINNISFNDIAWSQPKSQSEGKGFMDQLTISDLMLQDSYKQLQEKWKDIKKHMAQYSPVFDELWVRHQWLDMMISTEAALLPLGGAYNNDIQTAWMTGKSVDEIVSAPQLNKKYVGQVVFLLRVTCLNEIIKKILTKIQPSRGVNVHGDDHEFSVDAEEVVLKKGILLIQPGSAKSHKSIYLSAFSQCASQCGQGGIIKIITPNFNDKALIKVLKDACERGIVVQIVMDKYKNYVSATRMGGGGSSEEAMNDLLDMIGLEYKENLQVRWKVFNVDGCNKAIDARPTKQNVHQKYASFNQCADNGDMRYCIIASSPLDKQGQEYSQEIDVLLDDKEHIDNADRDLFQVNYDSGIDLHWCLAIDYLKKAGFYYYADFYYQRYIQGVDVTGQDPMLAHRAMLHTELNRFVNSYITKAADKYQCWACVEYFLDFFRYLQGKPLYKNYQHMQRAQEHMSSLPAHDESDEVQSLAEEQQCLAKLSTALDQYSKHKFSTNKKYMSLWGELQGERDVEKIKLTVDERITEQTGRFHENSFAVCLAKNGFFEASVVASDGKNNEILTQLHTKFNVRPPCSRGIFSTNQVATFIP